MRLTVRMQSWPGQTTMAPPLMDRPRSLAQHRDDRLQFQKAFLAALRQVWSAFRKVGIDSNQVFEMNSSVRTPVALTWDENETTVKKTGHETQASQVEKKICALSLTHLYQFATGLDYESMMGAKEMP